MYPHPESNVYLQGLNQQVSRRILNRAVNRAMLEQRVCERFRTHEHRIVSTQPSCFAPDVDASRARCAFGDWALPKLMQDLRSHSPLTVRQAVTTLGDLLVDPEKSILAVNLKIPERLTNFLASDDAYLRERSAMIYATMANQAAGREAILRDPNILADLLNGLGDRLAAVRSKVAQVLQTLARDYHAANQLNACGFAESITARLPGERREILLHHLDTLSLLLLPSLDDVKRRTMERGAFEELTKLLERKDEEVLSGALSCLALLCEVEEGRERAIETNLLRVLRGFLRDKRESLNAAASRVASFVTISTPGKLSALKLGLTSTLVYLALSKCQLSTNGRLLLPIIKTLSNIAEAPEGRKILLEKYVTLLESINVARDEVLQRHKQTLLDIVRWQP